MNLVDRTRDFALGVIRLCAELPNNRIGEIVGRQLLKSGTSPGAHFREALRARSKAEYVSKMNGGLMELEETLYWLEIAEQAQLLANTKVEPLKVETNESHGDLRLANQEMEGKMRGITSAFCLHISAFCLPSAFCLHTSAFTRRFCTSPRIDAKWWLPSI